MSKPNEVMIEEIRNKLNIVNPALINPEKFKNANQDDIADMHRFVMSKDTFFTERSYSYCRRIVIYSS